MPTLSKQEYEDFQNGCVGKIRKFSSRIYGEDTIYIEEKLDKVVEALKENSTILEKSLIKSYKF